MIDLTFLNEKTKRFAEKAMPSSIFAPRPEIRDKYSETIKGFVQKTPQIASAITSPISTFVSPQLRKFGVPSAIATGIGFIGDIAVFPGGAEEKASKELEVLAEEAKKYKSAEELLKENVFSKNLLEDVKGVNPDNRWVRVSFNPNEVKYGGNLSQANVEHMDKAFQEYRAGDKLMNPGFERIEKTGTQNNPILIESVTKDGKISILDGSHRLVFARDANKSIDAYIPKSQLTDFYNQVTKGNPVKQARQLGYKISQSEEGFTNKGFKYRIQKGNDLMYANTPEEIANLTGQGKLSAQDIGKETPALLSEGRVMESYKPSVTPQNKYVKDESFNIQMGKTDKITSRNLREEFSGNKNSQIVRGNQLRDSIKRNVSNELERRGMFWYKAAGGDETIIRDAMLEKSFDTYKKELEAALNLSNNAKKELQNISQYYDEAGRVSEKIGTIRNVRENYQNRIYEPEPPKDFVKTELSGIRQTTQHAKARIYDTEFDAVRGGKKFATTDIADTLSIHNEEMARVNTSRKMAEAMADKNVGSWRRPDNIPDGWEQVGNLEKRVPVKDKMGNPIIGEDGNQFVSHSVFVAPKGIAKGLKAITDPNFMNKVDTVRNLQRWQGLVKTVDLSFSFFHHFTMLQQATFQGEFSVATKLPKLEKTIADPTFQGLERDFARSTGMTSDIASNQDILRDLVRKNKDTFGAKVENLPGVKQVLNLADANTRFLFNKMQRVMKVTDWGHKVTDWIADHPNATNEEIIAAKRSLAKEINNAYGGLNWEALGITKTNLGLLRNVLLAPDWTLSNLLLAKQVFEKGAGGSAARAHAIRAIIAGMVETEGMNKILTGHFTDENPKGHFLEVEVSPGVYVSMFRGPIGDWIKLSSMIAEQGVISGTSRFSQGKLAPFARTGIGLLENIDYTGRRIVKKDEGFFSGTAKSAEFLARSAGPIPFGVSNEAQYITDPQATLTGALGILSGVARYSPQKKKSKSFNLDFLQ